MAENKKSFVGYADWVDTFEMLEDSEAGKLVKHLLRYINDKEPVLDDKLLQIAFNPIKLQLKRDLVKWEGIKVKRSDAGKKSAEVKKCLTLVESDQQTPTKATSVDFDQQVPTKSTVNDNVNVTVNVNDNVINGIPLGFEMQQSFLNINPRYPSTPSKDMPAITEIAAFLYQQTGGKRKEMFEMDIGEKSAVLRHWQAWCEWYKNKGNNKSLDYLVKFKLQDIFLEIQGSVFNKPGIIVDIVAFTANTKMVQ